MPIKSKTEKQERFNRDRAARILVDAIALGDKTAADRHQVSVKTVQRHRARLRDDPKLSAIVQRLGREAEHGWHFARARFLRKALQKLEAMVDAAEAADFPHVIAAVKAAGELDLTSEALGVGRSSPRQNQPAQEAGGDADPETEPSADPDSGDDD